MEQLKHTPGPWYVIEGWDENGNGKYFPSVVLYGPLDDESGRRCITINASHDQQIPSLMANAKLIATAPDLLEDLLMADRLLRSIKGQSWDEWPEAIKIRETIDKATK